MKRILLYIAHLHHHNVILNKTEEILAACSPVFTLCWLLLIEYGSQFIFLFYFPFYFIIYWSLL